MTKKDYIKFADAMRLNLTYLKADNMDNEKLYYSILQSMVDVFKNDNCLFNENKFYDVVFKNYPELNR